MSIVDAKGNLHSEQTGRFIHKDYAERLKNAQAIYDGSVDVLYLSVDRISAILSNAEDPQTEFHRLIRQGMVNLTIKRGLQDKHIEGTKNYLQEIAKGRYPSILTADPSDLIRRTALEGKIIMRNGSWDRKEYIRDVHPVGFCVNQNTGEKTITYSATLHFSNGGVHIVPRKERRDAE